MGDALLEHGAGGIGVIEMHGVGVAGKLGEGQNVLIGDRLGVARLHADGQILEKIALICSPVAIRGHRSPCSHAFQSAKIAKPLLHCNIAARREGASPDCAA